MELKKKFTFYVFPPYCLPAFETVRQGFLVNRRPYWFPAQHSILIPMISRIVAKMNCLDRHVPWLMEWTNPNRKFVNFLWRYPFFMWKTAFMKQSETKFDTPTFSSRSSNSLPFLTDWSGSVTNLLKAEKMSGNKGTIAPLATFTTLYKDSLAKYRTFNSGSAKQLSIGLTRSLMYFSESCVRQPQSEFISQVQMWRKK